jgi:hypothetical protein
MLSVLLLLSTRLEQSPFCAAVDNRAFQQPEGTARAGNDSLPARGTARAGNESEGSGAGGFAVQILSPFNHEPLEAEEMHLSIDVSALPIPCSVDILVNNNRIARHFLEVIDPRDAVWTWRLGESVVHGLDGFNSLGVEARQAVCTLTADAQQECSVDDSAVIARADVSFEIVKFTKLRYSGACPAADGGGSDDPSSHTGMNVTQEQLIEILKGTRAATTSMLQMLSPMVANRLFAHQHRGRQCPTARFVVWNSFGVHGFGSQLQALRIGLEYGFRTNRIVVQNPEFEAHIVQEDLKLRFAEHGGKNDTTLGWGAKGLYWDNMASEEGEMYKLSECDDHVLKWL